MLTLPVYGGSVDSRIPHAGLGYTMGSCGLLSLLALPADVWGYTASGLEFKALGFRAS